MHDTLLQDLALVLLVSAGATLLFHQLRQPVVLGYLLAGLIVGPFTPGLFVQDAHTLHTLAELGMVLLMFSLGLHFNLRKLVKVGVTAVIASTLEIGLMLWIGYQVGQLFGWSNADSIFLGALLSISSTTIIIKALQDLKLTKEPFAELVFGILIVEDILGIALLALLPTLASEGNVKPMGVAITLGRLALFLTGVLVVGLLAVPPLLRHAGRFRSDEMLVVTAVGLCFGTSLLAQDLGYSVALGAFLAGAIVAEAREGAKIEHLVAPVRDMFSAVFFVATGMLLDPRLLVEYALPIAVLTVTVVVGKVVTCTLGVFLAGHDVRTSLRVGMGLAQIGEFSFIIAVLGQKLGLTSSFLYPVAVAVSAVTTLLTPYLIRGADGLVNAFDRNAPPSLVAVLHLYGQWVSRLGEGEDRGGGRIWRALGMVVLDMALVTALLVGASALGQRVDIPLTLPAEWGGKATLAWLIAMLLALPLLLAALYHIRALGKVVAATRVPERAPPRVHVLVAATVSLTASVLLAAWVMLLSASQLPSWPVFATLALMLAGLAFPLRRSLIDLYRQGKTLIEETLAEPPGPPIRPLPPLLRAAQLETVAIAADTHAAGKLIRELELRQRTGASAVGIERDGQAIVNPGPDEELRAGDQVLLLGDQAQLERARELLTAGR